MGMNRDMMARLQQMQERALKAQEELYEREVEGRGLFLDEQRYPVGFGYHLRDHGPGKPPRAGHLLRQPGRVFGREPFQISILDMRLIAPRWREIRPECEDKKGAHFAHTLDEQRQKFLRRGIYPMHVLEHDE
jgi:hypothetical protein